MVYGMKIIFKKLRTYHITNEVRGYNIKFFYQESVPLLCSDVCSLGSLYMTAFYFYPFLFFSWNFLNHYFSFCKIPNFYLLVSAPRFLPLLEPFPPLFFFFPFFLWAIFYIDSPIQLQVSVHFFAWPSLANESYLFSFQYMKLNITVEARIKGIWETKRPAAQSRLRLSR